MITTKESKVSKMHHDIFTEAVKLGLIQQTVESNTLNGRRISIAGQHMINFGSCSYLGLETDSRLKEGVVDAVMRFGTQFSSSRIYAALGLYDELEELLEMIFGNPVLVTGSTTLGHVSFLPNLVGQDDVVILDAQVHASVQNAVLALKANGIRVEKIRHSNLQMLENRIWKLRNSYSKIWYCIDGVYSMFGDGAPVDELRSMQKKYEQLNLYVDDAHGMSWAGRNGRGYFLGNGELPERVFLATSLNKSFACAGGALIMPDRAMKDKIRTIGMTAVFCGPVQPPMLGACIASARIHLSKDIDRYQMELKDRIEWFCKRAQLRGLPVVDNSETPVFFIGCGKETTNNTLAKRLMQDGFYTNVSSFPAVPLGRAGVRLTITRHQTLEDIERLTESIAKHLSDILVSEGIHIDQLFEKFNIAAQHKDALAHAA